MFEIVRHHKIRFYAAVVVFFVAGIVSGAGLEYVTYARPLAEDTNHRVVITGEGYHLIAFGDDLRVEDNPVIWRAETKRKVVALTFDDGPHNIYTPQILKILNEKGVKATFFVVGQEARAYPGIVAAEHADGHEVENHSYSHPEVDRADGATMGKEIHRTDGVLKAITGRTPQYFRPPKGMLNETVVSVADAYDYEVVLWSVSLERSIPGTSQENADRVVSEVQPGAIILAHDGQYDRSKTVETLPYIIDRLLADGYRFVTLEELLRIR